MLNTNWLAMADASPERRMAVTRRGLIGSVAAAAGMLPLNGLLADSDESLPQVEVRSIRRAFHNGEHNAFTDLCWFGGRIWLTFRTCPDGHMVHPTSRILILSSADNGRTWQQRHEFSVPLRDTRDPHFLVFRDRLFVYTGTWYSGKTTLPREDYDLNLHLGYAVHSENGLQWSEPQMLEGTFGHYIWRAAVHGDRAFLCGRRKPGFEVPARGEGRRVESLMLESEDGLIWRQRAVFQDVNGDETAFRFESDGRGLAVARAGGGGTAGLLRCTAPGEPWERSDLGVAIGGPLLVRWQGRDVVAGRRMVSGEPPRTQFWWLSGDQLHPLAQLPSDGDNSYPGLVTLPSGNALVSWYSSHESDSSGQRITAIYLAELVLV